MSPDSPVIGNFKDVNRSLWNKFDRFLKQCLKRLLGLGLWGSVPVKLRLIILFFIIIMAGTSTTLALVSDTSQSKHAVLKSSASGNSTSKKILSTLNPTNKNAGNQSSTTVPTPKAVAPAKSQSTSKTSSTSGSSTTQGGSSGNTPSVSNAHIAVGIAVDDSNQNNNNEIANYVNAVGSSPNFVQWYQSWSEPLYYSSQETSVTSHHLTPIISWTSDSTPLTSISSGGQNSTIDAAASLAKQWPGTLYIRFDFEMNVTSSAWDPANLGETASNFVSAWQYVVNRFSTDGVSNVKWIWSPNVNCSGSCPFDSYYPGSNYVNMVGLDGYNYAWIDNVAWESFATVFQSSYNDIVGLAPGKPVDVAETASAEANSSEISAGDSKASWIQDMSSYLPTNMPDVTAITWWSAAADQATFEVNSSSTALAAWKNDVIDNSIYQATLP